MSKKRKIFVGIIIFVLIIVSLLVFSTIKGNMLPKSENPKKVQEVAKEVLSSEEADSVIEAPTEKLFTYWGESNDVSVYLMEPEKNQYPAIEMGEGNYTYSFDDYGDGYVTQLGNFLEFQFTYFFHGEKKYRKVFQAKEDGTYQVKEESLVETLQLKSLLNCEYDKEKEVIKEDEFLSFCNFNGKINSNILIRKDLQTGKETHFYFDDYYRLNFPEKPTNQSYQNVYLKKTLSTNGENNALEIWKFNLTDNSMVLVETLEEEYMKYDIAINNEEEIFVAFTLYEEKTWGYFLNTKQYVELDWDINERPVFRKEGVYIKGEKTWGEGFHLINRDGSKNYIGNFGSYCQGDFYDNMLIGMTISESLDIRENVIFYRDTSNPNEDYKHMYYPPKDINGKMFHVEGWSYEDGIIYGYYVSEDETEIEKFRVN